MENQHSGAGDSYSCILSSKFDSPPLFSPNIYIPDLHEKKSFGPRGYLNRISYLVDKAVYPVLETALKHNFSISWKRGLDIQVLEARNIDTQLGCCCQEVRCKVSVGDQIRRTELASLPARSNNVLWNQTLHFTVEEPNNIKLQVYVKRLILPNDVVGYVTISPNQLVENSTVTNWFPFDVRGDLKLSISLSRPDMLPFKFMLASPISLSFRNCHLLNARGEKVFTIMGTWPNVISILDVNDLSILTVKNKVFEEHEKIFRVYMYGQTHSSLTITWYQLQDSKKFYLEGLSSVSQIEYYKHSFSFTHGEKCAAVAKHTDKKYNIEVSACPDTLLLLAAVIVVAKLLDSDIR